MINRRDFIGKSSASLLGFGSVSVVAQQAPLNPVISRTVGSGYTVTNGPHARKRDDGLWKFTVRIINIDDREHDVIAFLQFSTDRSFSQIVDRLTVNLQRSRSFIAHTIYQPKLSNSKLFFRYVISIDDQIIQPRGGIVGSISPWEHESGIE
jgi:hypothetical protein